MEYWVKKADDVLLLISDQCHLYRNRFHSAKPIIPWPRPNTYRLQLLIIIEAIIQKVAIDTESRQGGPTFHYSSNPWQ
jgi:hypothetical protein